MNRYEKLIEYIINDETDKARALFHDIVVEKSREIYESLIDEEDFDHVGGNQVDSLVDEIESDEHGMNEEGDEFADDDMGMDDDGMDGEFDDDGAMDMGDDDGMGMGGDEFTGDEEGGEGGIENRVMDLEDALDQLKAEFDRLVTDEVESGHSDLEDMEGEGDEEDFGGDEEGSGDFEDEGVSEAYSGKSGLSGKSGSGKSGKSGSGKSGYGVKEAVSGKSGMSGKSGKSGSGKSGKSGKSAVEAMREYVEKVTLPTNKSEGHEAGKGGGVSVNKQSIVAGKNDMGGTTANIVKGGSESTPDGTSPKKASNYGTKGQGKLDHADKYQNVPGADTKGYDHKESAKKGEEGAVNKKSEIGGRVRNK